jgi:hypothetical protein
MRSGIYPVAMSLVLAHSGCGGGQTGQPSSSHCDDIDACSPVCREVGWEEEVHGVSARSILDEHGGRSEVPLFWVPIPEEDFASGFDASSLEPAQAESTELSIELVADEIAAVLRCGDELWVPVHAKLATEDGLARTIETTLVARPTSTAPEHAQLEQFDLEQVFPWQSQSQCLPRLASGRFGWQGRFCAEERLGLLQTSCGGVAQAAPDQAPFASSPSPIESLSELESFTMVWNDLPPITVAVRVDDPTACWGSETDFVVDAEVTIESGGVVFTKRTVAGQARSEAPVDQVWSEVTSVSFAEVCGDVSSSPDWLRVLDGRESSGELCVGMAKVSLDGMPSGWANWERVER